MTTRFRIAVLSILGAATVAAVPLRGAEAVPSFARQTGLGCAACHTAYPELNAFGREFKLRGYTLGASGGGYPPLALMFQPGFSHTAKTQEPKPVDGFNGNNNVALSQASLFYAGRIYDKLGAFAQLTYSGTDDRLAIDNTDIRYANDTTLADEALVYGFTLNNNPTVADPWNTLPAWGYPFASSDFLPGPGAATLIDGGLGQQVAGLGGYLRWNGMIYAELTGYRTLGASTQTALGITPAGEDQIDGVAPYWRLALTQTFGNSEVTLGTFGLAADTHPDRDKSAGSDHRIDVGLDGQYQFSLAPHDIGLYLRWIHEAADWNASRPLGLASNGRDTLDDVSVTGSYLYDLTYGADIGFHAIGGGADLAHYTDSARNGSPATQSLTFQLDWLPFNKEGGPSFWPWFNPKFVLQYTKYLQFDGAGTNYDAAGRDAGDNDTLYVMMWAPL